MPYLPYVLWFTATLWSPDVLIFVSFPSTWPVYPPAQKVCVRSRRCIHVYWLLQLANWLENYADTLELNYWTSSKVVNASQDPNNMWHVTVQKGDGSARVFVVKHLIFALGFRGGEPYMPQYPGMVTFALMPLQKLLNIVHYAGQVQRPNSSLSSTWEGH